MNTVEKYKKYVNTAFVKAVEPVVITQARGATVTDETGKTYTDLFAGISVVNAGHCNPAVLAAAKAQMDQLVHCCSYVYHVPKVADLAEKLAQITPGRLQKSFFGNGGAEANEGAMRLAKQATKRQEFISLQGSFHGRSLATLSITGNCGRKRGGGPYLSGCAYHPAAYCYRCPYDKAYPSCDLHCAKDLERTIQFDTADNVAAFIAEPVMGEGGIVTPPPGYFQELKKVLDNHGILLFVDEVQSGFGRTGKLFAIEHWGVEPDILTMAKGIADGFPLSCFIAREEIADAFRPGDHLSTFGGNPVSCAAALANIDYFEQERLCDQAAAKGKVLLGALKDLQKTQPLIGEVRGHGLMIGVELVRDARKSPATEEAGRVKALLREKGFLIGVGGTWGNVLRIQPPLVIPIEDLLKAVETLGECLAAV
jgi:4-aminobutyrate aminotransferase / (S)-3-amino-2-methylpropionate transaminase / 5-aminovalerate transaminase